MRCDVVCGGPAYYTPPCSRDPVQVYNVEMAAQPCPKCGETRVGSFRFCRMCGFDFDQATSAVADVTKSPPDPIDLFPPVRDDRASPSPAMVGMMVISGILVVFIALLVLRPLG
jgi:hypothetical protein